MEAIENGHQVTELREFLQARGEQSLPETVEHFVASAEKNSHLLHDSSAAHLIECADAALAELFAADERTKQYCRRAGDPHLVVPAKSEAHFRKALPLLGYCIRSSDQ
jgi:hypothetical protein